MNLNETREVVREVVSRFFAGATVIWAEQVNTKPSLPYATIKFGAVERRLYPVEDPSIGRCYHCSTTAEVNLYTEGKPLGGSVNAIRNSANTAVSDLLEFTNFVESEAVLDLLAGYRIEMSLIPPVRDLAALENDRKYRYRAMAEFTVTFVMEASGWYGIGGMPDAPNFSGGGSQEMADEPYEIIEDAEIEEMKEN